MTPLGVAELNQGPIVIGARLTRWSAGRVVLADALRELDVKDETRAAPGTCRAGDFVAALIELDVGLGVLVCRSLQRVGPGTLGTQPRSAAPLVLRQAAESSLRSYFQKERFLEVRTPTFGVCPGLDPYVQSLGAVSGARGQEYLMTSPEFFMKRLLSEGVPRLYQLSSVFRAEELGAWHEPEFTLLEWYRAYEGLDAVMQDTERLVRLVADALGAAGSLHPAPPRLEQPFSRVTVREAFSRYAGIADACDYAAADPAGYFQTYVDQVEPGLAALEGPVFLTEFPASQAALARLSAAGVALRFELLLGGVELCNGYDELTDPNEQRRRFEQELGRRTSSGEPRYPLDESFLAALEVGMPPAAGNALGFERLLTVLSGASRIESFYAFPAARH